MFPGMCESVASTVFSKLYKPDIQTLSNRNNSPKVFKLNLKQSFSMSLYDSLELYLSRSYQITRILRIKTCLWMVLG